LDKGQSYMLMDKDLPAVAVHDLVVHPTTNDLLVGTHGRSIYKANIGHIQALTTSALTEDLVVFDVQKVKRSSRWGTRRSMWSKVNEPSIQIPFYAKNAGGVTINIQTEKGVTIKSLSTDAVKGLNYVDYDLTVTEKGAKTLEMAMNANLEKKADKKVLKAAKDNDAFYLEKGTYKVEVVKSGTNKSMDLVVN